MNQVASNLEPQELLENEVRMRVESAAAAVAQWDVVHHPANMGEFSAQVSSARRGLLQLEVELARHPVPPMTEDPAEIAYRAGLLELGASHRLLRSAKNGVSDRPKQIAELPRVQA